MSGELAAGTIKEQTRRTIENIKSILIAAKIDLQKVVKVEVYMKDLKDFKEMNKVYEKYFSSPAPARVTVEVSRLPKDALIEMSCIAIK